MAVFMEDALDAVREVLDAHKIHYNFDEEDSTFHMTFSLKRTKLSPLMILLRVVESNENPDECTRITSLGLVGIKADEECMSEMAEFLHRANFGSIYGCFELDFSDGEIRYRMSINCVDALPGEDAIEDLWGIPGFMLERYGNGILAVSMGFTSAKEAIDRIENR